MVPQGDFFVQPALEFVKQILDHTAENAPQNFTLNKGDFTHKPRAVAMKLWEPKESIRRPTQDTSKIM